MGTQGTQSVAVAVKEEVRPPVDTEKTKSERLFRLCEVTVLVPVLLIVVGLFLIPIIYYTVFILMSQAEMINPLTACTQVSEYSGEVCRDELTSLQMCFSGVTSPPPALNIPSVIDQQTGESDIMRFVNGFSSLSSDQQCSEAIMPFLCLSVFNLCDSSSTLYTITRQDCIDLRDGVCTREWSQAIGLFGPGVLPACEDLPDDNDDCIDISSDFIMPSTGNKSFECSEWFYFDENGTEFCRPICGEISPKSLGLQIVEKAAVCMGFVACVIMFILALTVQRKSLLTFPIILFVYLCITAFFLATVVIAGFFDTNGLFCGSMDQIDSTIEGNETAFCTITGFVFYYTLVQSSMWGLLHTVFLFWAVVFPFSYRQLRISGRIRYAHIISVVLAVVIPLPAPLAHLKDGYVLLIINPPLTCLGRNTTITFFTYILTISIILAAVSCQLVIIFSTIFKKFVLKKLLAKRKVGYGKSQFKIIAIVVYYTVLGVLGLAFNTYYDVTGTRQDTFDEYFICERFGNSTDCSSELKRLNLDVSNVGSVVANVMLAFLPVVSILYACNPRNCCRSKKKAPHDVKLKGLKTPATSSTAISS